MEFRLHYRGELKSNRGPADKQALRRIFHSQLKELWTQQPLSIYRDFLKPRTDERPLSVLRPVGHFVFAPLIVEELALVAELDVLFLRPGAPGTLIGHGGDIDNRIKTLLDALTVPAQQNAIPADDQPLDGEDPFFCLLEDDSLITRINVETDRLLDAAAGPSDVKLIIKVTTRQLKVMWKTIGLA